MEYGLPSVKNMPTQGWLRFVCAGILFSLIFWYPWETQKNWQEGEYLLSPDSPGYIEFNAWTHPWRATRSIGYPAFIYPFLYPDQQKFVKAVRAASRAGIDHTHMWRAPEAHIYTIASEVGITEKFDAIVLAQRLILPFAISAFYLSLCRWFCPVFSFLALGTALWLAPPPNPHWIMAEPLSCAFTWLCGAFLLFAPTSSRKRSCYALACFCAAFAFLVRPQMLSLTGLCSLVFLYEIFFSGKIRHLGNLCRKAATFSPLLLAYGYIAWLSVTGGGFYLHTLVEVYYSSFCAFVEADDAKNMPTERSRKFTSWFGEHKKELIGHIKTRGVRFPEGASPAMMRVIMGDGLLYGGGMAEAWKHFATTKGLSGLRREQQAALGKELNAGLQKRHTGEIFLNRWQNFVGALGYYKDVYRLSHLKDTTFITNIIALAIILVGIIKDARIRWPLTIMTGIHILALMAAALGHLVLSRYVEPTEPLLLLAGMCACWGMGGGVVARLKQSRGVCRHPLEGSPA